MWTRESIIVIDIMTIIGMVHGEDHVITGMTIVETIGVGAMDKAMVVAMDKATVMAAEEIND